MSSRTEDDPSDAVHCVYAVFEMGGPQDDYRAFSYIDRLRESLPDSSEVIGRILGRYRGPPLAQERFRIGGRSRGELAPHRQGWPRLWRYALNKLGRTPIYHWFSSVSGNQYALLRAMRNWTRPDAKVVFFAQNLHSALKLVELAFLYATVVPQGMVVVLLGAESIDPAKVSRLKRWGVSLLLDATGVSTFDRPLAKAIRARDFGSIAEMPLQARKAPNVNWLEELQRADLRDRDPEKVLFIRPDWMKCGSATTFGKLAKLFQERDAILIDVALQPYRVPCDRHMVDEKISEVDTDLSPAFHFNLRRDFRPIALAKMGWHYLINRPRTIAGYMPVFYMQCAAPRTVKELLANAKVDYIYNNHYFTLPLAKLLAGDRPVFLDTHDVQSLNYVSHDYHHQIKRRAAPFSECLKEELAIVDKADRVTMVSRDEINLIKRFRPNKEYLYYIPLPATNFKSSIDFKCTGLRAGRLKLLVVAAWNPANERSLRWFLGSVWPSVHSRDVELNIVGAVAKSFKGESFPSVTFHGLVDNLQAYYEAADLIVLPITNGGGIAIKTLEAIMLGMPIVASSHALRGLTREVVGLLPHSAADEEFITDLLRLISDPEALEQRRVQVQQARQCLIAIDFDRQMHRELDAMRPSRPQRSHNQQDASGAAPRFLLVAPASPGSKGDEGMMRGALNVLAGSPVVILNPDLSPLWLDELNRAESPSSLVTEVTGELSSYIDRITPSDIVIVLGADVIDGSCGTEPSISRLSLVLAALNIEARAFIFCSFRSNVDFKIIEAIEESRGANFFLRDPVSIVNFERQISISGAHFPDFFSYCKSWRSTEVDNYKKHFDEARNQAAKIVVVNASEHAFRSFYDEHTEANRRKYVGEVIDGIIAALPDAHLILMSNDSRSWDNFLSDADYQAYAVDWLRQNAPSVGYEIINPQISYPEILNLLEGVDLVVTGRMHLALAAFRAGVLPIVLMGAECGYTNVEKMRGSHLKYLGRDDFVVSRLEALQNKIDLYQSAQVEIMSSLRRRSSHVASELDLYRRQLLLKMFAAYC